MASSGNADASFSILQFYDEPATFKTFNTGTTSLHLKKISVLYTLSMTFIEDHKELSVSTSVFTSLQFTSHRTSQLKYLLHYTLNCYIWLSLVQAFIKKQPRIF